MSACLLHFLLNRYHKYQILIYFLMCNLFCYFYIDSVFIITPDLILTLRLASSQGRTESSRPPLSRNVPRGDPRYAKSDGVGVCIRVSVSLQYQVVRVRLHQASDSTLRQLCDDASNSVLIENIGDAPKLGCNPFPTDSIVFNENRITGIVAELL